MIQITRKDLGKRIGTTYYAGIISITTYENGFRIKPVKQKPIFIDKTGGALISTIARCKDELYTYMEARKIFEREVAEQL